MAQSNKILVIFRIPILNDITKINYNLYRHSISLSILKQLYLNFESYYSYSLNHICSAILIVPRHLQSIYIRKSSINNRNCVI